MNKKISLNNISFNFLKGSSEFLNLVLNNISSCILLLDKNMELQAFNDVMVSIFSSRKEEDLLYVRCGEALGCAYNVDEMKNCGATSYCNSCSLRESALISYYENKPIFKDKISREFYMQDGKKTLKYLQFSTRCFKFNNERYIIMIIDDITRLMEIERKTTTPRKEIQIKAINRNQLKK